MKGVNEKRRGRMQSEENLGKKREERCRGRKRQEQSIRWKGGERHTAAQRERREGDGGLGQERLLGGAASSWVGMGTWGFVYYPTGTEPGASFIGFWLRDE